MKKLTDELLENQKTWSAMKAAWCSTRYATGSLAAQFRWIIELAAANLRESRQERKRVSVLDRMTPEAKFKRLMVAFGKRPADLPALRAQTATAAKIWGAGALLFGITIVLGQAGVPILGMAFGGLGLDFSSIVRTAGVAAMALMAVQHARSNWIFRTRRHGGFVDFLRSGDWIPRAQGRKGRLVEKGKLNVEQPGLFPIVFDDDPDATIFCSGAPDLGKLCKPAEWRHEHKYRSRCSMGHAWV